MLPAAPVTTPLAVLLCLVMLPLLGVGLLGENLWLRWKQHRLTKRDRGNNVTDQRKATLTVVIMVTLAVVLSVGAARLTTNLEVTRLNARIDDLERITLGDFKYLDRKIDRLPPSSSADQQILIQQLQGAVGSLQQRIGKLEDPGAKP